MYSNLYTCRFVSLLRRHHDATPCIHQPKSAWTYDYALHTGRKILIYTLISLVCSFEKLNQKLCIIKFFYISYQMCSDQLSSNQIIDFTIPRNKKIVEIATMKL